MGASCRICPRVKNSRGEEVDSRLFTDLLHYTSNDRETSKSLYQIAMNQEFINEVKDKVQFDENGEITLRSLLKVTKTNLNNEKVLKTLNKDIGSGTYSYQDAIYKLHTFNRDSQWKDKYMATITSAGKGQYQLSVVKRSRAAENRLNKTIANQVTQDRLISILASHGVAVDFLEGENATGRYSTENATRSADGLYHLIRISNGENVSAALAEEAGHFAIGALGNNPLVERLINLLTPEVQREALGEDVYNSKLLGKNPRREVAGDLVGQALINNLNEKTAWGRLANKIANLAKKVFYKIKGDEVKLASLEANKLAEKIAQGLISPNFTGSLEQALSTEETLYSAEKSYNIQTYDKVIKALKSAADEFRAMNSDLAATFDAIIGQIQSGGVQQITSTQVGALADKVALDAITEAMDILVNLMGTDIPELLNTVDFDNTLDFAQNMARNAQTLHDVRIATNKCLEIMQVVNDAIDTSTGTARLVSTGLENIEILDSDTGRLVSKNLIQLTTALSNFVSDIPNGFFAELRQKEYQFFLKFLEDGYGKDYVNRGARAVLHLKNVAKKGARLVEFVPKSQQKIDYLLRHLESDDTLFDRFLASMSNSSDIINQIVDKIAKAANKQADDIANNVWDQLKALETRLKETTGSSDTSRFYERDRRGNLTGNILDTYHWGEWENNYKEFENEHKRLFKEKHRLDDGTYDYDNMSDFEKALLWQGYFAEKYKKWNEENSVWDEDEKRYVPNFEYINRDYDRLSEDEKAFLKEIMSLKNRLDTLVPGAMPSYRMPQFKGTFMTRVKNRGSKLNPVSYAKGMREVVRETFCVDSEDIDYGGDNTYNSEEEVLFEDTMAYEKEQINRLPLFGINKLQDMSQLSTNMFQSMLAYASMATHYFSMNQIVNGLEVGKEVLHRYHGKSERTSVKDNSRAFNRYLKFLDKQVYGVSQKKIISHGIALHKVAHALSSLASKIYLGGNVAGGLVNLGTGINEIFKEAASGEFFTIKDWAAANLEYWKSFPRQILDTGELGKESHMELFIRHFNVLGQNKLQQREWHTERSRLANFLYGECLMLPYSAGDHYMQTMSYLAVAKGTKLIDRNGNEISLWDAYQKADIVYNDSEGNTSTSVKQRSIRKQGYGKTLALNGVYFKNKEDRADYNMIESILDVMVNAPTSSFGSPILNFTQEQTDWLNAHGYNVADYEETIALLKNALYNKTWNVDDETAFMDKCREINDRLHGIYNDQDKTAFHQEILGNMLLSMRGYALGMIQRRFGSGKYSVALGGQEVQGTLTTVLTAALAKSDDWNFKKFLWAFTMPFSKRAKDSMLKAGFSANQYANMRRNFMDYVFIAALFLIKALSAKDDDDDEEERKKLYAELRKKYGKEYADYVKRKDEESASKKGDPEGLVYYFSTRLLREQAAFNTAIGFEDEWRSLGSLVPSGVSILKDFGSLAVLGVGDLMYDYPEKPDPEKYKRMKKEGYDDAYIAKIKAEDKYAFEHAPGKWAFYSSNKKGMYKEGESKFEKRLMKMLPYYRSYNVYVHPYESTESFLYGRKVAK